ncbi:MAG: hypothetical protein ACOC1F_11045, partial [Myxococcota bacterium]
RCGGVASYEQAFIKRRGWAKFGSCRATSLLGVRLRATQGDMARFVSRGLGLVLAALVMSCGGSQKSPDVPEGHKLCRYCCTTASIECSCMVLEVVECPDADNTGILPACAECRTCTRSLGADESCGE